MGEVRYKDALPSHRCRQHPHTREGYLQLIAYDIDRHSDLELAGQWSGTAQ
jgi:hypothetical protein